MTPLRAGSGVDLFPLLHLSGVACGYADLEAPWEVEQRQTSRHWLYVVQSGACWIEPLEQSREPIRLGPGDLLAVANDSAHRLRHAKAAGSASVSRGLALRPPAARGSAADRATTV